MAAFLYRCPVTKLRVQSWIADDPAMPYDHYEAVTCHACARSHMVNPKTGKVLGEDDDE